MVSPKKKASWLLAIGYWVQGFRGFPWTAVFFFLKDTIKITPSALQLLQSTVTLPMVLKPFYGVVSDTFYFRNQHRLPYISLGAILQTLSWLALGLFSPAGTSLFVIGFLLTFGDFGASIAEVANEAIVAELGKPPSSSAGELQSFAWIASSIGGVLGNLLGGIAIENCNPKTIFLIFGFITALQFVITITYDESSINLSKSPATVGFRKQLSDLGVIVKNQEILRALAWVACSYVFVPSLTGTMFYYQTQVVHIDASILGVSKVVGQGAIIIWSFVYNKRLKSVPARKLAPIIQAGLALFMLSDILFVKGFYRNLGVPDTAYVVVFSGLMEVVPIFKILPFSVLVAQLCPQGHEGSLMAIGASIVALSLIVGGYLGALLAAFNGVTGENFSAFPRAIVIEAACTIVPVLFFSLIPEEKKSKNESITELEEEV